MRVQFAALTVTLLLASSSHSFCQTGQRPRPTKAELETLAHELKTGGNPYELFSKHGEQSLVYALAGLELCPTNHSWGGEMAMIFADDRFKAKGLRSQVRTKHFVRCRDYLSQAVGLLEKAKKKYPADATLSAQADELRGNLALAQLETGDTPAVKLSAQKQLSANTDAKSWNYGNVIHEANSLLGRAALKEGDKRSATEFLLKAGNTPGSPQLNSFGPDFTLARELLKAGEKQGVLDYLDLVAKFWIDEPRASGNSLSELIAKDHEVLMNKWRAEIQAGGVPSDGNWR